MQIVEVTLGKEDKKSDGNYGSTGRSAFVKVQVHPGDDLDDVLRAAHAALDKAIAGAPPITTPAPAVPRAPVGWVVKIDGPKAADPKPKAAGFRWKDGCFVRTFPNQDAAEKAAEGARLLGTVTVEPPAGDA